MKLTRKQFEILTAMAYSHSSLTQRELRELTGYSLGTVNSVLKSLADCFDSGYITPYGLNILDEYKAKRAVILAAGFGGRLIPITLNTPKALVRVFGKRIIDGIIDACLGIGITDITIVRGYLSEQFDQLLNKYPMLKFIDNPEYNETGNISSALAARHLLSNAYVFEADLLINKPTLLKPYHYQSDFLGIQKERSDDWCFSVKDNLITGEGVGGINCWQMVGISYWNREDGKKLSEDISLAYNLPGGKERFWEQVPLVVYPERYKVEVQECHDGDIVEIDTLKELQSIDKSYRVF